VQIGVGWFLGNLLIIAKNQRTASSRCFEQIQLKEPSIHQKPESTSKEPMIL
jgi:hypothetical protein